MKIFKNGTIVTIDDKVPYAEAVVVEDGIIKFVGSEEESVNFAGGGYEEIDLKGNALLPGFIDPHSHFIYASNLIKYLNISSPPVGTMESFDDIVRAMRERLEGEKDSKVLIAMGYDDSLLKEKSHPTRDVLDRVSSEIPVFITHVSGHVGVANSKALEMFGYIKGCENPKGGVVVRYPGTDEPNGLLEENAIIEKMFEFMSPDPLEAPQLLKKGQEYYFSNGITTCQDGATTRASFEFMKSLDKDEPIDIDLVMYPIMDFSIIDDNPEYVGSYKGALKIGGAKYFLDGSPQAKTAWLSRPYHVPPKGEDKDYKGYPVHTDGEVYDYFRECLKRGVQVLVHCNGDQASQQMIDEYSRAMKGLDTDIKNRPVMIHSQTVREDQLDRMKDLGIIPSFFVDHTYYWGDWHRESTLGEDRGSNISPTRWAVDRGIDYTLHQDTPIVPPNMIFTLHNAVNRKTRSNRILGEHQRLTVYEALKGVTINAAKQYFEEDTKGSIEKGKNADFVILDRNPLKTVAEKIKEIEVVSTYKKGEQVYKSS